MNTGDQSYRVGSATIPVFDDTGGTGSGVKLVSLPLNVCCWRNVVVFPFTEATVCRRGHYGW